MVEIVIYLALVVILLGAIINAGIYLSKSYRQIKAMKDVQMSALSVMDIIVRNIRSADSIDSSNVLTSTDVNEVVHTTRFYLSGGRVMMEKDGQSLGPLTESDVTVDSLVFRQIDTGNSFGVKLEMTIEGKNFYTTAVLRGSYL